MSSEYQIRAYPRDLALFVRDRWPMVSAQGCSSLPDLPVLEHLISVCYQASLLQEEGRPVRFRLIFLAPDQFPPDLGPPAGLHRLLFRDKLPFTERELQKDLAIGGLLRFPDRIVARWEKRIVHLGNSAFRITVDPKPSWGWEGVPTASRLSRHKRYKSGSHYRVQRIHRYRHTQFRKNCLSVHGSFRLDVDPFSIRYYNR